MWHDNDAVDVADHNFTRLHGAAPFNDGCAHRAGTVADWRVRCHALGEAWHSDLDNTFNVTGQAVDAECDYTIVSRHTPHETAIHRCFFDAIGRSPHYVVRCCHLHGANCS